MSNFLRTIQQVTKDYVDSINHRIPSIKNGTVTATSSDGTATVRVDGNTATTGSVPSIATVKTGDRVKMVLFNRQLTILGAIQRTDKLDADTFGGQSSGQFMRYLPGNHPGASINGFDANTVDRVKPSMIPIYNGVNTPSKAIGVLETIPYSWDWVAQYFHEMQASGDRLYRRTFHSATTWSAWEQLGSGGNATCPFPVGYIVTNQGQNPATQWPGTTWARYAAGRVLVGQDTGQTEFNTIGKTGGAKTHTLTVAQMPSHNHGGSSGSSGSHTHTASTGSSGSHTHAMRGIATRVSGTWNGVVGTANANVTDWSPVGSAGAHTHTVTVNSGGAHTHTVGAQGGGAAHNNLQPYAVVVHWRRTA